MDDDNKFSYFFLGLGLGVAAGLLFAPKSGPETRDLLRSKADEGKEYLKRRTTELGDQASDVLERGKFRCRAHASVEERIVIAIRVPRDAQHRVRFVEPKQLVIELTEPREDAQRDRDDGERRYRALQVIATRNATVRGHFPAVSGPAGPALSRRDLRCAHL